MSFYAPDAVWDAARLAAGRSRARRRFASFLEDWRGRYEELEVELEEFSTSATESCSPWFARRAVRSAAAADVRAARRRWSAVWVEGLIVRVTTYTDIDEARAAAERLAEERG